MLTRFWTLELPCIVWSMFLIRPKLYDATVRPSPILASSHLKTRTREYEIRYTPRMGEKNQPPKLQTFPVLTKTQHAKKTPGTAMHKSHKLQVKAALACIAARPGWPLQAEVGVSRADIMPICLSAARLCDYSLHDDSCTSSSSRAVSALDV